MAQAAEEARLRRERAFMEHEDDVSRVADRYLDAHERKVRYLSRACSRRASNTPSVDR
jgi:hypothetical protein